MLFQIRSSKEEVIDVRNYDEDKWFHISAYAIFIVEMRYDGTDNFHVGLESAIRTWDRKNELQYVALPF